MSSTTIAQPTVLSLTPPARTRRASALLTLARRRAMLTSRTPRQIAVPLVGPAMLALILAPALKKATGGLHSHIDYTSFVGVGAIGLVIPLSCVFVGLSALRGGKFHVTGAGVAWFLAAAVLFTVFMYALAETVAAKVTKEEDFVGATPVIAILPFFFAGALFPISPMPGVLTAIAKAMPLTHALALLRYGVVDPSGKGLHEIW